MATIVRTVFFKSIAKNQPVLGVIATQNRSISSKTKRSGMVLEPKPKPFDYENKFYSYFRSLIDRTTHRLDENSKVIVVEGPIAVGKTEFAKQLAEELEMKHFPEANMDFHYITRTGVNLRDLDPKVPEDCRTFDQRNFCRNPNHRLAANYQLMMYVARFGQYVDALAHLLNTGQGVVLERCPFSDYVFVEAMHAKNFMSSGARSVYYQVRANNIRELLRPHCIVYLDIPVNVVQKRIKERNLPHELNSPILDEAYLTKIEEVYKHKYLTEMSPHCELLVYDWTAKGDPEVVIEDIERIDFDKHRHRIDPKLKDWRMPQEVMWADKRMVYTNHRSALLNSFNIPTGVPELITSADDYYETWKVYEDTPGLKYTHGYNEELGDTSLLTKNTTPKYQVFLP